MALVFAAFWVQTDGIVPVVLTNIALNAGLIAGWHVAVATYALVEGPDRLADTFALTVRVRAACRTIGVIHAYGTSAARASRGWRAA